MSDSDNLTDVSAASMDRVGYVPRSAASPTLYEELGFRCGLEVHQQLKTEQKLFCRCPAGSYQRRDSYDAQLVRHMRPTLSELGEYDGTALMEFKTKKNIVYRIKGETACTYDIDDTPPFAMNREALDIAMQIALLLGTQIVGELHITRKQYLDGSIPTGFQRTAIVGIHGEIPMKTKSVRIHQLSIEEDSCREVSDVGHQRVYSTDRLGTPLVETVTYPDLLTPDEAEEAAQYIRFLTRSTGNVNVGIGAAREDVNVSIEGGTRVEIKGVQHIRWIPELTHNEAFRQKALLAIRSHLKKQIPDPESWKPLATSLDPTDYAACLPSGDRPEALRAINLPGFAGVLSSFTNPGRCFADEISDRIKVIACIEKPNMTHSEGIDRQVTCEGWRKIREALLACSSDVQILLWGPAADMETAIETIEERCRMAFLGVPNETRKALADGTTLFERVLPGPNRMYPDTDSVPIPIDEAVIERVRSDLPMSVATRSSQMQDWGVPEDCRPYIHKRNLYPLLETLVRDRGLDAKLAGTLLGHTLRHVWGDRLGRVEWILNLVDEVSERRLTTDILKPLLPHAFATPQATLDDLLERVGYMSESDLDALTRVPSLVALFKTRKRRRSEHAIHNWIMGQLRSEALGNVSLADLAVYVEKGVAQ